VASFVKLFLGFRYLLNEYDFSQGRRVNEVLRDAERGQISQEKYIFLLSKNIHHRIEPEKQNRNTNSCLVVFRINVNQNRNCGSGREPGKILRAIKINSQALNLPRN
jgi:hypothetical protein